MRVHAAGRITVGSLALLTFGCTANWGGAPEAPAIEITSRPLTGPQATFPNVPFAPEEVGKPVAIIKSASASGAARGHSNVAVINGHLLVPFAPDSGLPGGGLSFYDLSDPRRPVLVKSVDEPALREAHGFGFSTSYGGNHAVFQTIDGIQFWDLSDVSDPRMIKHLVLPGILASDYAAGAWWAFWQAPYVYVGGSGNGLYVVDASDLLRSQAGDGGAHRAHGRLSHRAGLRLRQHAGHLQRRPAGVRAAGHQRPAPAGAQRRLARRAAHLFDAAQRQPHLRRRAGWPSARARRQRSVAHRPGGAKPARAGPGWLPQRAGRLRARRLLGGLRQVRRQRHAAAARRSRAPRASPPATRTSAWCSGNLVFVGNDHGVGTALLPHQTAPDTTAARGQRGQPRRRRQPAAPDLAGGPQLQRSDRSRQRQRRQHPSCARWAATPLPGKYSTQTNLANFTPDAPLLPDTTYEVVVPAGGVRDYAGNPISSEFRARFATGTFVAGVGLRCLVSARDAGRSPQPGAHRRRAERPRRRQPELRLRRRPHPRPRPGRDLRRAPLPRARPLQRHRHRQQRRRDHHLRAHRHGRTHR